MSGPVQVFVQAEDPAVRTALVAALTRQGGIVAADSAEKASWIVVTEGC